MFRKSQSRKGGLSIWLIGLLFFIASVYGAYRLGWGQGEREKPSPGTDLPVLTTDCDRDGDCSLVLDLSQCCSCPKAVSRQALQENRNLTEHDPVVEYKPQPECAKVVCSPCLPWNRAVCQAGECKGIHQEEECVMKLARNKMSLSEAEEIARASECLEEGELTGDSFCNEITGTWWLDLDIQKEGCNPACVISVVTQKAEVNWRCTGALPATRSGTTIEKEGGCRTCGD